MLTALRSAASGLIAQKRNMDIIANNIANISTTGFKKSRLNFTDTGYESVASLLPNEDGSFPEFSIGQGVSFVAPQTIFSQGNLRETGNPLDIAIAGPGFFQVTLPDGRKAFSRDGALQIDTQGRLTTPEGYLIDPPVAFPPDAENVQVGDDGVIRAQVAGEDVELGSITLAAFKNPEGLAAIGHNLYISSEASGEALIGPAGVGGRGQVISGVLESSNVDLAEEMTKTLEAQRAYQLAIKALQTSDEMLGLANNLRR